MESFDSMLPCFDDDHERDDFISLDVVPEVLRTDKLCMEAVRGDWSNIQYIPPTLHWSKVARWVDEFVLRGIGTVDSRERMQFMRSMKSKIRMIPAAHRTMAVYLSVLDAYPYIKWNSVFDPVLTNTIARETQSIFNTMQEDAHRCFIQLSIVNTLLWLTVAYYLGASTYTLLIGQGFILAYQMWGVSIRDAIIYNDDRRRYLIERKRVVLAFQFNVNHYDAYKRQSLMHTMKWCHVVTSGLYVAAFGYFVPCMTNEQYTQCIHNHEQESDAPECNLDELFVLMCLIFFLFLTLAEFIRHVVTVGMHRRIQTRRCDKQSPRPYPWSNGRVDWRRGVYTSSKFAQVLLSPNRGEAATTWLDEEIHGEVYSGQA